MIITVEGPTGAGKSAIALKIAQALSTDIINCDSRQIYKYMDIGTAKPTPAERDLVTHHLFDIITPNERYNAGRYVQDAQRTIQLLQTQAKIPLLCGGTGLYVKALLEGLFEHPPIDPALKTKLKQELQQRGTEAMYKKLQAIDPTFADKISAHDPQRILRGLEVFEATGRTLSQHWSEQQHRQRYKALRILVNPERDLLYQSINDRMQKMLARGLIAEIESLLARGYTWTDPGLNSLGYKEFKDYFTKAKTIAQCAQIAAQHHRNYAKRQVTWYRKQKFDLTISPESVSLSDILRVIKPDS